MSGYNSYRTDLNKGLPSDFILEDGKFQLKGGAPKAEDNVYMLLAFSTWYREYYMDFCVDIGWLLQRPTSMIQTFKTMILGKFIQAADRYIPFVQLTKMNTYYVITARKEFQVSIEYMYNLATNVTLQLVKVINI